MIELLPGERVLLAKAANAVINSSDFGLSPLPGAGVRRVLLGGGDESLGGRLTLTDRRVVFETHAANRVHPILVIPLESITAVTDASRGISRMLRIEWESYWSVFVVWGIPALIAAITGARNLLQGQRREG